MFMEAHRNYWAGEVSGAKVEGDPKVKISASEILRRRYRRPIRHSEVEQKYLYILSLEEDNAIVSVIRLQDDVRNLIVFHDFLALIHALGNLKITKVNIVGMAGDESWIEIVDEAMYNLGFDVNIIQINKTS